MNNNMQSVTEWKVLQIMENYVTHRKVSENMISLH